MLYFGDGKVRESYTPADGLGEGPVAALRLDRDGALWAATQGGGLSRIKDRRVATLTTRNGLPCDTIHWSMEDDDRSLWLYAACGLVRITRTELDAWIADPKRRIETAVWDAADGVSAQRSCGFLPTILPSRSPPMGGCGSCRKRASRSSIPVIFLSTGSRRRCISRKSSPTGDSIGNSYLARRCRPCIFPPLTRELQVDYVGLSFVAPENMQFRIKLEGQDDDWRVPVNPRHSRYTNLKPGKYTLRVKASNNSGVWNEQGDTLELWVAPAYYQTHWFRALCVAAFMALLWAAHQVRVRQVRHQFEMTLEARVGERTRIARELHDTLLQSAHGVLLRFQTVSELLPERPTEAKATLDRAIEQTAEFITEARDEVQGLRDSTTQTNDLALAINSLGEGLASDPATRGPVTFQVAVEGESRDLQPILRDEIYKIAAEALRNAFRHAEAREDRSGNPL